jgi:hypothetical protein
MEIPDQRQNFANFGEMVLADRELHDRLRAAGGEAFVALVVQLGMERGCVFTPTVVEAVLGEQQRAWLERWL